MKHKICLLIAAIALMALLPFPALALEDGEYCVSVEVTGGSGKATVNNPTLMQVIDGKPYALLTWSSSNYDYMVVDGTTYYNQSEEGRNSTFLIPITVWDYPMAVLADTTAMGKPVEIHYQLFFYEESVGDKAQLPQEAAKRVLIMAGCIIIFGGILNSAVKKRYE